MGKLGDAAFGPECCQVVTKRGEGVAFGRAAERGDPSPLSVVDIEVLLDHPAIGDLKMPAVRFAVADRGPNASRLARPENDHDGIGLPL